MAADQLSDKESDEPVVGIRHQNDRRIADRRAIDRGTPDRRRRERRRAKIRGMIFSVLAFVLPHQVVKHRMANAHPPRVLSSRPGPRVSTAVTSVKPVDPSRAYDHLIREAAQKYGLNPVLIKSVIRMESQFDAAAVSRVGAMGLMQLMPDVAADLGVSNPFDPRQNIMAGSKLLRDLLDRHKGNLQLTLASYNAGPGTVAKYRNRVPPFRETRNYVKTITEWMGDEPAGSE